MADTLDTKIMTALSHVRTAEGDIVSRGMVSGLHVTPAGDATFVLEVDPALGASLEPLRLEAEKAARQVKGIKSATVIMTAERKPPAEPDPHGMNKNPKLTLPFRHVIAVASGKGGVGKSTAAFNLAVAMSRIGLDVCLLDADIYGPSVPRLTGLTGRKPMTDDSGKIVPLDAHGIRVMSMGFLVEEEKPMIWRGPMVQTAFYQMLRDVAWQKQGMPPDVLIIDMPPGTGDVQLTLSQKVPVSGAVIVSTPQDIALIDARKAIAMFEKTNVKILGIIENMSYYCCPACGQRDDVFGHGGAEREADIQNVPYLGNVPLNGEIRKLSDEGNPLPENFYNAIAEKILNSVNSFDFNNQSAGIAVSK